MVGNNPPIKWLTKNFYARRIKTMAPHPKIIIFQNNRNSTGKKTIRREKLWQNFPLQ